MRIGIGINLPVQQYPGLNILSEIKKLFAFDSIGDKITKKYILICTGKMGMCQKIHMLNCLAKVVKQINLNSL